MVQPYLIAMLMCKGQPMLWQGEEFGENYFLPEFGAGRVALLRALRWEFFYDAPGQGLVKLVRKLLRIRETVLSFAAVRVISSTIGTVIFPKESCYSPVTAAPRTLLVAINTSDVDQSVPFWFPIGGSYLEELHGGDLNLTEIAPLQETSLQIPSHYGRVWTTVGP